ncbi:hypothetical protein PFISCL1PPCAC_6750, partial [Pristionchus fissidentatus]
LFLQNYRWNTDGRKPEKDAFLIMNNCFPTEKRTRKLKSEEYWIWHNTNAQSSFAVYFGFFPFYLQDFDAVAFLSAAREDSLIPAYLMSNLFQEHLAVREFYEGERWQKLTDDRLKESLEIAHKITVKFPLTDELSIVHYETPDGQLHSCSVQEALVFYSKGFFSSEMKFAVAPPGENVKEKSWMVLTLKELIERNGKAMPFVFATSTLRETWDRREELLKLKENLIHAKVERLDLTREISRLKTRISSVRAEILKIADKHATTATRSSQTVEKKDVTTNLNTPPTSSQIIPRPGVDPFALLKVITEYYRGHRDGRVAERIDELHSKFSLCNKKLLVLRTVSLMEKNRPRLCRMCDLKMQSASNLIEHVCSKFHQSKVKYLCGDALDFWFDAIASCTDGSTAAPAEVAATSKIKPIAAAARVVPAAAAATPKSAPAVEAAGKARDIKISPDSPFGLLRYYRRVDLPCQNVKQFASILHVMLRDCDKKALDADPILKALFNKSVSCDVCIRTVSIDKPANLIAHWATSSHVTAATKDGGQVSLNAINYWMAALHRATKTN